MISSKVMNNGQWLSWLDLWQDPPCSVKSSQPLNEVSKPLCMHLSISVRLTIDDDAVLNYYCLLHAAQHRIC